MPRKLIATESKKEGLAQGIPDSIPLAIQDAMPDAKPGVITIHPVPLPGASPIEPTKDHTIDSTGTYDDLDEYSKTALKSVEAKAAKPKSAATKKSS